MIKPSPLLFAALLALAGGCETVVEIEPTYEAELHVEMYFHPGQKQWEASVYHTVPFNSETDAEKAYVADARLRVLHEGERVAVLEHAEDGQYAGDGPAPEAGQAYTVTAEAPGFEPVQATSRVPKRVPGVEAAFTDSVGKEPVPGTDYVATKARMHVAFEDPADRTNYYQLVLEHQHGPVLSASYEADHPALPRASFREVIRGDGVAGEMNHQGALFTDATFKGQPFEADLRFTRGRAHAYQTVLRVLSEDLYRYQKSLALREEENDNPFREPAIIHSNVENGAGIVAGYLRQAAPPVVLNEFTSNLVAGSYSIGEYGDFSFRDQALHDPDENGGRLEMTLRRTGEVSGALFMPAKANPEGERVDVSFEGTYELKEGIITFQLSGDTFIEDLKWFYRSGGISTLPSHQNLYVRLLKQDPS